ncbi:MAG TPA: type II toxin-antitoxin system HipA family toxin YjjJ [Steroidobacteraceae bacterium]|nr:type II toxin-antitoxin system HipA family toxin YjjJ [Steroidobacteraceae bacterium]
MSAVFAPRIAEHLSRGPASAAELCRVLEISQPSLSRALRPLEAAGTVVRFGATRGARYGLAHVIGTIGSHWPLYRIDETGTPLELGTLHAVERDAYYARGGPVRVAGFSEGLPYYLQDLRPAGFLGRAIPAAYPELALPARVRDWTDEHVLTYLTRRGSEAIGDLMLGQEALNRYLSDQHGPPIINADARPTRYPELADQAMAGAPPGSSAHGEHPKFSVRIRQGTQLIHALVKFSPPRGGTLGERWADLLIAEGVASEFLGSQGIPAATNRVLEHGNRVFLESWRFDRMGGVGRRGVATLFSVDVSLYGKLDRWSASAARLQRDGLLAPQDAARIALLEAFGGLIANTDRHFGNITLFDGRDGPFSLAPVYDMLPMLFAPIDGQLIEREFVPEGARAETFTMWPRARELALGYWTRLVEDTRLTPDFRTRCRACLGMVEQLGSLGRGMP